MVGDFIICLLAFFNIFIYLLCIFLFKKKEGSRKGSRRGSKKGSKKGSKRGVQKGGSTFCLQYLEEMFICLFNLFVFYPFLHYEFLKCIP